MCISTRPAPLSRTNGRVPGSAAALTSFTMAAPASIAARATSARRVSTLIAVTGDPATRRFDHRHDPGDLLVGLDRLGAWPRGFPTHVEDVGAVGHQGDAVLHRVVGAVEHAAVAERVRRHVDDAHDQRPFPQREHVLAAAPDVVAHVVNRARIRR